MNESAPDSFSIAVAYELRVFYICLGYLYTRVALGEKGAKQRGSPEEHIHTVARATHQNILLMEETARLSELAHDDPIAMETLILQENFDPFYSIFTMRVEEAGRSLSGLLNKNTILGEHQKLLARVYTRVWPEGHENAPASSENIVAIAQGMSITNALLGHIDELLEKFTPAEMVTFIKDQNNIVAQTKKSP
ncbi:MAG: hypothetical protein ACSHX5_05275 [Phycisphaerales bacterium]